MSDFDISDMAADPQPSGLLAGDTDLADRMGIGGAGDPDISGTIDEAMGKLGIGGGTDSGHEFMHPEDVEPIGARDMEVLDEFNRQQGGTNDAS